MLRRRWAIFKEPQDIADTVKQRELDEREQAEAIRIAEIRLREMGESE